MDKRGGHAQVFCGAEEAMLLGPLQETCGVFGGEFCATLRTTNKGRFHLGPGSRRGFLGTGVVLIFDIVCYSLFRGIRNAGSWRPNDTHTVSASSHKPMTHQIAGCSLTLGVR